MHYRITILLLAALLASCRDSAREPVTLTYPHGWYSEPDEVKKTAALSQKFTSETGIHIRDIPTPESTLDGLDLLVKLLRMGSSGADVCWSRNFHQTARCVLTVCVSRGDKRKSFHRAVLLALFRERDRQPARAETPLRRVAAIKNGEARGASATKSPVRASARIRPRPFAWPEKPYIRMVPSLAAGAGASVPLFPGTEVCPARDGAIPYAEAGSCDPQSFRLRSEGKGKLVRAEGLEPSRALRPNGFSYPSTAFAAPALKPQGLGSGLSLHRVPDTFRLSGAARLVSTPSQPES
jgi:hypothetical protein